MSSSNEPGSSTQINGVPMAKQALEQKRNVRDLNTRLEMYVRAQAEKSRTVTQLKEALARQEMELKNKMKQQQLQYMDTIEKLRKENENLAYDYKSTHEQLLNTDIKYKDFEARLIASEEKSATQASELHNIGIDLERKKQSLDALRKEHASMKYKYESYEMERQSFEQRMNAQKVKNESLLRELTTKETNLKAEKETFQRVIIDKNDEIESLQSEVNGLKHDNNTTQSRLRHEFDEKLADFVTKREDQYRQEKEEWMRIFKEEFNRKLRSFKEANQELSHSNVKQSEEINELRTRISKLKQQKTELEMTNRTAEEEMEKLRSDFDDWRHNKENEISHKNAQLLQERDRYTAKEIQFDELASIKQSLDSEIELYRRILSEAERECGYESPLDKKKNTNTRKRKRLNSYGGTHMTPMGPLLSRNVPHTNNKQIMSESETESIVTPGLARAAENAKRDLGILGNGSPVTDVEMCEKKDSEEISETPMGMEGGALQFSGLDLNKGMIEVQNMGERVVSLSGYSLVNGNGEMQYSLPPNMELQSKQTLRIYVGKERFAQICDCDSKEVNLESAKKFVGKYEGAYVFWGCNVWTGDKSDCARLYDPEMSEIARIDISPEMVDESAVNKGGCCVM